ncbi:MAG: PD40 domain-containing protein [Myxococcales bacterium]|nr:PD40 domain-containing protein [Myxococcales bacterium]
MGGSRPGRGALPPAIALLALSCGCASVRARFPQEVAASFASQPMRKLETDSAEIYYPERARASAQRVAARMSECLAALRRLPLARTDGPKALVFLTSANFNNAFVAGQTFGEPLHVVAPLHVSPELFGWLDFGLNEMGDVGCHELVHYVQLEQVHGLWGAARKAFGELIPSQVFLEAWFLEGLAQYYEGRLGKAVGRPHSPVYRGVFEAAADSRGGRLAAGDLNLQHREHLPFGGAYLAGLPFIEFLARRYGEDQLWELVDLQGHSWLPGMIVTLRFQRVYGKAIDALLDEFRGQLSSPAPVRQRPESQRLLWPDLGYLARIAGSPADGSVAVISAGLDEAPSIAVHERDGSLRFRRPLARFAPARPWISAGPLTVSGMSFTADGRSLYLMNGDVAEDGGSQTQLWRVDPQTGEVEVLLEGLVGLGGSVSPDGTRYLFTELADGQASLSEIDLRALSRRTVFAFDGRLSPAAASYAPDGSRIAFAARAGHGFDLFLLDGGKLAQLTADARFDYAPRFVDDKRLLFERERDGRVQAHVLDLETRALTAVSDAPFVALDPVPIGGEDFAFVNREGVRWTLDAAPIEPVSEAAVEQLQAVEPAPVASAEAPQPQAQRDEPYSPLDGLFRPTLHAPFVWVLAEGSEADLRVSPILGLSLRGQDRLNFHAWAVNAALALPARPQFFSFEYGTQRLAPWFGRLLIQRTWLSGTTDTTAAVDLGREVWTTPVSFGLSVLDRVADPSEGAPTGRIRLSGARVGFDYFAGEGTPYAGVQRALGFAGTAQAFPTWLGSDFGLLDVRAVVTLAPGLPLLRRHSLVGTLTGRALPGAPGGLLQVGGIPRGAQLVAVNERTGEPAPKIPLPAGLGFAEAVRGYEDYSVRATNVAVLEARYRCSFIIDHGWASTLYVLPSLFVRQVDLEAFGSAAVTDSPSTPNLRAAGGALFLRAALMQLVPLSAYYQLSFRFDAGLPPLHVVGLSVE